MGLTIYYDSLQEAEWFASLAPDLASVRRVRLGARGSNPQAIDALLRYDRPDIILSADEVPKLVLEKTSEVPTGHNVTQRFGRVANAAEERVPFVYFLPFKAMKHGTHPNVCHAPARLYGALGKMTGIHEIPILAVRWPVDSNYELVRDGSEDDQVRHLVRDFLSVDFEASRSTVARELEDQMVAEKAARSRAEPRTLRPPPSVRVDKTDDFLSRLNASSTRGIDELHSTFHTRRDTLTYTLGMTPENCRREDPYVGTQFLYDYFWCRNGPRTVDKHTNLVLSVPKVGGARWTEANPNDASRKSAVYYATADAILLSDRIIACTSLVSASSRRRYTLTEGP